MANKKALICGVTGQDGSYLAQFLLAKGYEVVGTSRDAMMSSFRNLEILGIRDKVRTTSMAINDFRSVLSVIQKFAPDEIYNLAGQTSVGLSFEQPVESIESIASGTLNLLEVLHLVNKSIKFYNAGSSECFGDTGATPANENSPFHPRSPYAVAKASAHWLVRNYRESYGLFAGTGILFNHESPLRPERFVTQKIIKAASRIAHGSKERLELGNLQISRDWGWAPEYVEAMWKILQQPNPDDFIICTGQTNSLEDFVAGAFAYHNLDWQNYVDINNNLLRPSDIKVSSGNPNKAKSELNWSAKVDFELLINKLSTKIIK